MLYFAPILVPVFHQYVIPVFDFLKINVFCLYLRAKKYYIILKLAKFILSSINFARSTLKSFGDVYWNYLAIYFIFYRLITMSISKTKCMLYCFSSFRKSLSEFILIIMKICQWIFLVNQKTNLFFN